MSNSTHAAVRWALTAAVVLATPTWAATAEDAQRIVDRAEPLRCRLIALEARARQLDPALPEFEQVSAERDRALVETHRHFQANWAEFAAVMATLSAEDKEKVDRYSAAMSERCAIKACGVPICPEGARQAKRGEPPEPQRPASKVPYVAPGQEGAASPGRGHTRIQGPRPRN